MSFVSVVPDVVGTSASALAGIGDALEHAHAAAAARTTAVVAAAEDEVSTAIAALFSGHGLAYQALSAQAAAFHSQLFQTLPATPRSYPATKPPNPNPLHSGTQ